MPTNFAIKFTQYIQWIVTLYEIIYISTYDLKTSEYKIYLVSNQVNVTKHRCESCKVSVLIHYTPLISASICVYCVFETHAYYTLL